jgi:nicotinamide riboside kinase
MNNLLGIAARGMLGVCACKAHPPMQRASMGTKALPSRVLLQSGEMRPITTIQPVGAIVTIEKRGAGKSFAPVQPPLKQRQIAVYGTQSVGKSTWVYFLATWFKRIGENVRVIQELVHECPFPINDKMIPATAKWLSTTQMAYEEAALQKGATVVISDRTPLDTFMYARRLGLKDQELDNLEKVATVWLNRYDALYWIRPDPDRDHKIIADGIRSTNMEFMRVMDAIFAQNLYPIVSTRTQTLHNSQVFGRLTIPANKKRGSLITKSDEAFDEELNRITEMLKQAHIVNVHDVS